MIIATKKLTLSAVARLQNKVNALNKRAERLGLDKLEVTIGPHFPVTQTTPSGLDITIMVAEVTVTGCAPCINGWEVVARIEFTECGNLVHHAPGIENIDSKYRTIGNVCEHCNKNRRRNDIIVIRHHNGSEKCVGRNCLADFLRTDDAEDLLAYANYSSELDVSDCDDDFDFRAVRPAEAPLTIISAASICIRKLGWVSGSTAYENGIGSTKDDVFNLLYPPKYGSRAYDEYLKWIKDNDLTVTDYDRDLAANVLEWAQNIQDDSDYLNNLRILCNLPYVGYDKFGYVVSAVVAYNKACERRERAAKKGSKAYIGKPKMRIRGIKASCVGINSFEGKFGVTTLIRFEHRINDSEYAVLVWFASGDKTEDFEVGKDYTIDATIKDHNDHDAYGKQTRITRVSVTK